MLKIRRVDSCHQQQNTSTGKHQLQNLEDTEHVHIRTLNTKESHMRPLMFPEDQEAEETERLMGYVVPSVRRESKAAPRCRISLRLSHRPAGTMSSHPHLRKQSKPVENASGHCFCRLDWQQHHSPILWKSSGSCTSTFSLWNMWYSDCSQMGGIWLNCRATEYASYKTPAKW